MAKTPNGRPGQEAAAQQKFSGSHRNRGPHGEENFHMSADRRGEPCACDDRTPCLAHADITGRRRWLRPGNTKDRKP